jgi:16S rRNA (cytosine967-C5)-methyltransferase
MRVGGRLGAAIDLLGDIAASESQPADGIAQAFFRARRYIGGSDRRAISEIVWGVLRHWRRVGWWIDRIGADPAPLMVACAALVLDGWRVSELEQAFSGTAYAPPPLAPGRVAALRLLEGRQLDDPAMPAPVRLEVPDWLWPRLEARFGAAMEGELAALLPEAPLDLRVNLLQASREDAIAALRAEGIDAAPTPHSAWGLRVAGRPPVTAGAAFRAGLVEIQDEGSQLLARHVEARPDMRVLDYCAGAGGKTLALAMTMGNRGHIVAADVSDARLKAAVQRFRRAGVHNAECHRLVAGDKWAKRRAGGFDRVLVDAPCSGTGTWRRNPDARIRLRPDHLAELRAKQESILQAASALVKPGGRLIYGTCSLLTEENEDQVTAFLRRNPSFAAVGTPLVLTPASHGTDGFFGAALERAA